MTARHGWFATFCGLAGRPQLIGEVRRDLGRAGVLEAVRTHDTAALYNWMSRGIAYQGISDYVAHAYMEEHGSVTWDQVQQSLMGRLLCQKLRSHWAFHRCGYNKTNGTCNEQKNLDSCPLPLPTLRNGRLNQSAFSLYLFMRDVAGGDFVKWLDTTIVTVQAETENIDATRSALLDRLQYLFGLSNKMLTMILSDLLIGAARDRRHWLEVGASMIVVDTLVHNFLHRTGILQRHGASHLYGPLLWREWLRQHCSQHRSRDRCSNLQREFSGAFSEICSTRHLAVLRAASRSCL